MRTAGAPMMLVGDFGWHVGRAELDGKLRVTDAWLAWLDAGVPDDADVAGIVARWQASVSQENADFADKLVAQFRVQKFAGSETCAACHAAEYAKWKASPHAHAMHTLAGKAADKDPSCIPCHLHDVPRDAAAPVAVTSLGLGCEGCHGGAARHAELATRGSKDAARALSPATREACLRCHHPPNSSHFDFDAYWPKIAHGRAAAK
jgi:nitrate/TMAO reductase-like tetraheme cytochrome c subunit